MKPYLVRVEGRSCRLWENTQGTGETLPGSGGRTNTEGTGEALPGSGGMTILPSLGEHGGYG